MACYGNVLRAVPLQRDGYFFLPLWTDWNVGAHPGILDWYTVVAGATALVALMLHGSHYIALTRRSRNQTGKAMMPEWASNY